MLYAMIKILKRNDDKVVDLIYQHGKPLEYFKDLTKKDLNLDHTFWNLLRIYRRNAKFKDYLMELEDAKKRIL